MIRITLTLVCLLTCFGYAQSISQSNDEQPWKKPSLDLIFYKTHPNASITFPVNALLIPRASVYKDTRWHFGVENLFALFKRPIFLLTLSVGFFGETQNNDFGPILGLGANYFVKERVRLNADFIVSPAEDVIAVSGYPILPRLGIGYAF